MKERDLQSILIANKGSLLRRIDKDLLFVKEEYQTSVGRIDILAVKQGLPVGIELKAKRYNTNMVCGQLLKYVSVLEPRQGQVYFVAPNITSGVHELFDDHPQVRLYTFDPQLRFYTASKQKKQLISLPDRRSLLQKYVRAPLSKSIAKYVLGL